MYIAPVLSAAAAVLTSLCLQYVICSILEASQVLSYQKHKLFYQLCIVLLNSSLVQVSYFLYQNIYLLAFNIFNLLFVLFSILFFLLHLSLQDALIMGYPKIANDDRNQYVRSELEMFL